ncbi:MAG: hypothetical protein AXA67_05170 [Methylothermaceae bacteria B42]|nr:MAG: hypothetical protein AXA67_05170 [Methylothermaceae bacteria B42]HHJ39359.1 twin-arginine translocase subunit TatB [Methylothermaceae bacterium]
MFDIGFWELTLVGLISLLVLGPERLPGAVRSTMLWVRKARAMVATVKSEIEQELALDEIKSTAYEDTSLKQLKELEQELKQVIPPANSLRETSKPVDERKS